MHPADAHPSQPTPLVTRYGANLRDTDERKIVVSLLTTGRHIVKAADGSFTVYASPTSPDIHATCADVDALRTFAEGAGLRPFDLPGPPAHALDTSHGHWPGWGSAAT